jgi:3-hydroxyacyl-[acyl-carrier-protein] dehydratase
MTDSKPQQRREDRELDVGMIQRLLPHRYPMLLVDRVLDWEAGKFIRGIKNVTVDEPFFQGHFPTYPVMPGVLVIEAMAQISGLLVMLSDVARRDGSQIVLFAGIDDARFKRQVVPGDRLLLEAELDRAVRGIGRFIARASVDGQRVCAARLMAAIRDVPTPRELPR